MYNPLREKCQPIILIFSDKITNDRANGNESDATADQHGIVDDHV
jgi:hypothetical protein